MQRTPEQRTNVLSVGDCCLPVDFNIEMRPSCSGASLTNFHDANPNIRQSLQVKPGELSCPLRLADPRHFDPSTSLCECVLGTLTLLIVQSSVHLPPCVQVAGLHWALSGRLLSCRASAVDPVDMVLVGKTGKTDWELSPLGRVLLCGGGAGREARVLRGAGEVCLMCFQEVVTR